MSKAELKTLRAVPVDVASVADALISGIGTSISARDNQCARFTGGR